MTRDERCAVILENCGQPERVKAHCRAVAEASYELARKLNEKGLSLDAELCRRGGLLHDIRRTERWHSQKAMLVGAHMGEYIDTDRIAEKEVVYLADKITRGTQRVSVAERYARSLEKFSGDEEATEAAYARREQSLKLAEYAEGILGCPLEGFENA